MHIFNPSARDMRQEDHKFEIYLVYIELVPDEQNKFNHIRLSGPLYTFFLSCHSKEIFSYLQKKDEWLVICFSIFNNFVIVMKKFPVFADPYNFQIDYINSFI